MFTAIAIGSLLPANDLPTPAFKGIDKLEHMLGYAMLSGYAVLLFERPRSRWLATLAVVGFGVLIEGAQGWLTTSREADGLDVLANSAGALLGQLLAFTRIAGRFAWPLSRSDEPPL